MDNRTFGFLLITFAVCTTLTESFPRFLTNMHDSLKLMIDEEWQPTRSHNVFTEYGSGIPDDLSKSEESSEEESGSYSLETQQQQVLEKVDQFPAQSTSAEQQGDNQFTFTSSGEQFTVDPENSGTRQTEILFTGNPTASDKTGTVIDRQSTTSPGNADTINGVVNNSSHILTSSLTSDDSLSIAKTDSLTEKTVTPFTENSERTTKHPNFELETSSTSYTTQSIPIEPNPTNSQFTTLKSVETTAGISFETSDKTTQEEVSSTSEDKTNSHVTVTVSERSHKEDNGSSALQQKLNLPLNSTEDTSDTSDRCDSTTFVKPTADSEPGNAGKCGAFITDPTTPTTQFDMINTSTLPTASFEPDKQAAEDKDTILNNKSTFESNTGGALDLSGTEPIVTETSENKKTIFSTETGSQHLDQESITVSSESTLLTSSSKSSTNHSSSSSPVNTVKEGSVISTASDDSTSTEVTESADVILPDLLVKNEHVTDNQFLIAPPFLSKHMSKDGDKILYEFHTSNTTHDHLNHSDAGIPHNMLDEHTIHVQHDSPHTDASSNLTGNPHTTEGDEPLLPRSKHMNDCLHTKPTGSAHHITAADEPQIPHSHHMSTSHHTKPVASTQRIVGGDEPLLPHSHNMKTSHHTITGTLHHIIGGDEPKLPRSHHMNATHHTNTSAKVTAVNQVSAVNEPKLTNSSHEHASPNILRESITKKDPVNSTNNSTVGETVSGGKLSEQSESEVHRFIDTDNNERTTEQLLTESTNEDNLQLVHNDRSTYSSFISPVLFQNSKHASGMVLPETVQTDPSIKPTIQATLIDTSVGDNIGQVSLDELILVSDEQYPSENDEFPIRNLNSQDSELPQESVADIQFSDKPTVLQEHITDNSNSSDKQIEISEDSSVQNQGSSSFTSTSVSSVVVKTEDIAQQDATFQSGDILPKKQANGDLQYLIEQVIYPKQITSDIMNKQVSNEPSDIKTIQSTKILSEPSEFESHSKPCNCTQTIDKPLSTQTNTTLADKQSKSTPSSASVTDFTTEKPTNIQSVEEHRFTIQEILSTVPDDDNDTPNHGAVLTVLSAHAIDKTDDSSSAVSNVPISIDSTNEMTGTGSSFQGDETAIPDFLVSSSNDDTQHSIPDGKQTGNTLGYNTGSNYYSYATSTTKSTTSPSSTSLGTTSTSPDVETTSSTSSQVTTEIPTSTSSASGSTSSGTKSTYPDVETTSSSSQGTTENPTSSTSGSTSSGTTTISPDIEATSSSTSSQSTTKNPTSSTSSSTSSGTTSTSEEITSTSSSFSQGTTKNPTSSTSSSTSSGTASTSEEITSSSSSTSQGTTENPTFSTSSSTSGTTSTSEEITSSSSHGTTKNPISSTSSSTSSGSTSTEVQSTTPDYYTKAPPYGLLAPESSVNTNTSLNRGYLATTNKQSIEHFQSIENTDKDNIFSSTLTSDQLTTSFQTSDSSEIKFERPPKPYIGIKRNSKGGDRSKLFYNPKPWYYISESRPLQNSYKNVKN